MRSGCFNKKIIAVLVILLPLMATKASNESEDKYFSNKTDVLTGDILCTFIT